MIGARFNCNDKFIFIILSQLIIYSNSVVFIAAENSSIIEETGKCGGEFSGYQYTISTPNYPEPYPEKLNCVYILRGSHLAKCDQVFNLQFLDFSLPPSENCVEDYVEIGDRSLYCGRVAGIRRYVGKNNSLVLRFHSGARYVRDKGFKIFVTTLPCSETQIDDKNKAESTEQSGSTLKNEESTEKNINGKISTRNDLESFMETDNSYPIYRPEIDFIIEDNPNFIKGEIPSPPRVESLEGNENDAFLKFQENPNHNNAKFPPNSLEIPVHQSKLFREPISVKLEIVTPSTMKNSQQSKASKISTYLFVPPNAEKESTKNDDLPERFSVVNLTRDFPKNDAINFVTPPPEEILLPIRGKTIFRKNGPTNTTRNLPLVQSGINEKFAVPARSYGVPDDSYYRPITVFDQEIKTGEVLDNFRDIVDCQGKINLEPDLEATANYRENNPGIIDNIGEFGRKYYPERIYGIPITSYPSDIRNGNVDITLTTKYGPPGGNYPNVNFPGVIGTDRPNDWLPSANFIPSKNIVNDYPNINPSVGLTPGNIYSGKYSQCCRNVYSASRFLLSSPGFPSIFYSGNRYDCIYSIRPYSSNICQMRFNFKFFNYGVDDRFCTYGYVEIDGRRICGCKKGLSIVSAVTTSFPKIIGVTYTGYPRTKFNGFLIEVIQEPCSNSYPYLSRSKKDVGNSSKETSGSVLENVSGIIINNTLERTKRNLGYSYPKPNVGFDDTGFSQPWNSGNSINGNQPWNQGNAGGNLFSPLLTCQAVSFFDWTIAAKEVYLRNGRCVRNGGSTGYPPGNWNPGNPGGSGIIIIPGYPGNGGPGTINPGYPGNGGPGTIIPGYPGNGGPGTINPGYPGNGGPGTINPGYPGNGGPGTINPGYPGTGGPGPINPGYPGTGGPGTINPGYPGTGGPGTINPGYPGTGGPGTINPGYPGSGWNFPSVRCEDVNIIEGIISSPQYPTNYPNNVKKCFRFYKAPDSCQLELVMLDFDLENSAGCWKDYVAFSGQNRRYCGRTLAGSKALFDISRTNIIEMYFVSDGFGTGRGFSAGHSQIPCRGLINR